MTGRIHFPIQKKHTEGKVWLSYCRRKHKSCPPQRCCKVKSRNQGILEETTFCIRIICTKMNDIKVNLKLMEFIIYLSRSFSIFFPFALFWSITCSWLKSRRLSNVGFFRTCEPQSDARGGGQTAVVEFSQPIRGEHGVDVRHIHRRAALSSSWGRNHPGEIHAKPRLTPSVRHVCPCIRLSPATPGSSRLSSPFALGPQLSRLQRCWSALAGTGHRSDEKTL